jgi:hypothetical protein
MEKMENEKLYQFIELCKKDDDFIKISNYANSVSIQFNQAIYSTITTELIKLPNSFFIGKVYDYITNQFVLQLFIYKIKTFENEK